MERTRASVGLRLLAVLLVVVAMGSFVARPAAAQDDQVTVALEELNGSGVSGEATVVDNGDGTVTVSILVDGATGDHPAHIHAGTCENLDPNPLFPLANVDEEGVSETDVELGDPAADFATLVGGGYAINVHESESNLGTYVTCGNIAAEAQAADEGDDAEEADDEAADEGAEEDDATEDDAAVTEATVDLAEINDSGVSGTAELVADGEQTIVTLQVEGATGDHPVHIHDGTCDELGAVVYPLEDVDADGFSETTVDTPLASLGEAEYAINVHLSADEIETYVTCGNISLAAGGGEAEDDAEDDSADAAADDDAADTGTTTTGPAVGVGLTAAQSGSLALLGGLALLATFAMGGALALRRREVRIRR